MPVCSDVAGRTAGHCAGGRLTRTRNARRESRRHRVDDASHTRDEVSGNELDCAGNGCTFSKNIIRFNSFNGAWSLECSASSAGGCNVNNNVFYGNLGIGCVAVAYPHGGSITGTGWVDQGYNVQTVAKANTCTSSASSYSQSAAYAAPRSPSYNLDLSGATAASNFVPSSVGWPLTHANIHGTARSGASTNAGAY